MLLVPPPFFKVTVGSPVRTLTAASLNESYTGYSDGGYVEDAGGSLSGTLLPGFVTSFLGADMTNGYNLLVVSGDASAFMNDIAGIKFNEISYSYVSMIPIYPYTLFFFSPPMITAGVYTVQLV